MIMSQNVAITGMLQKTSNRVWMQAFIDFGSIGIGLGACVLLAGGLLHRVSGVIPATPWLLFALLPPSLSLLIVLLFRRPSLSSSARAADRWFNGHELLTSALSLVRSSHRHRSSAAALVLARANESAAEWEKELPLRQPYAVPPYNILSVVLAATGLLLFSLPGTEAPTQDNLVPGTAHIEGSQATPVSNATAASLRQQIQEVLHKRIGPDPDGHGATARTDTGSTGQLARQTENIHARVRKSLPDTRAITSADSPASSGSDTAAWSSKTGNNPGKTEQADFIGMSGIRPRVMQYKRRMAANPNTGKTGSTGGKLDDFISTRGSPLKSGMISQAAEPGIQPHHFDPGPAHKRLIANYFNRINSQ